MLFLRLWQHQHLGAPGQVRPQPVCVDGIFIVRAPVHPHAALRGALAQPGGLIRKVGHAVRALLIPYLMQQVAPGRHQMAHYAFASGIMNLSVMLTGMASGFLSDMLSYKFFFVAVMLATVPAFVITKLVPFTYDDKPNDK